MLNIALTQQYPDIRFSADNEFGTVTLIDNGSGPRIQHWNHPGPKPNEADVLAAFDESAWIRQTKIETVYAICQQRLDALSVGYAKAEIATWPMMSAEIRQYNNSNHVTIGPAMQAVIALGRHTATSLAAVLTPRIDYEAACLTNREAHVKALLAYKTLDQLTGHDVNSGWPAPIR